MLLQGLVRQVAAGTRIRSAGTGASTDCLLSVPCGLAWQARGACARLPAEWGDEPLPSSPPEAPPRRPVPDPGVRVAPLSVCWGRRLLQQEPWGGWASLGSPLFVGEGAHASELPGCRGRSVAPGHGHGCSLWPPHLLPSAGSHAGLGASPLHARLLMPALNRNAALPRASLLL